MPDRYPTSPADELATLMQRIAEARAVLARLNRDIAEARRQVLNSSRAHLLEVNERLVVAAMQHQTDADSAMQALHQLARTSELDTLTQLPNRALLQERFAQAIANAKRRRTRLALLFIDVDDFKHINDTWGHPAGDEVLRQTARCLASVVRDVDTVSRYGGDEFLILLTDIAQVADAEGVADKVSAAMAIPMAVDKRTLRLSVSIGISLYPEDGTAPETLIRQADAAMYRAKRTKTRLLPTLR